MFFLKLFFQDEIEIKKSNLNHIIHERTVVENNKLSLENQLQSNLLRKRENLTAVILIFFLY